MMQFFERSGILQVASFSVREKKVGLNLLTSKA